MNNMLVAMISFAKANKKKGFTHFEFNERFNTTCSTARLSDLRANGYVFKESINSKGKKRFWLVSEPEVKS
jgi:hypothetical protein